MKRNLLSFFLCIFAVSLACLFSACGKQEEVKKCRHEVIEDIEMLMPTCTFSGLTKGKRCADCGEIIIEQESIPSLGHNLGEWETSQEATCIEKGEKIRICSRCNYVERKGIERTEHNFGEWKTSQEATCAEKGEEIRICSRCNYVERKAIEETGHNFGSYKITKSPTCTQKGTQTKKCSDCGEIREKEVDVVDHTYSNAICVNCGANMDLDYAYDSDIMVYTIAGKGACKATDIVIPAYYNRLPVVKIESSAFEETDLVSVVISEGIERIEYFAFSRCADLASVVIPDSVIDIGQYVFMECNSLKSIRIPSNAFVAHDMLYSCGGLEKIEVAEGNPYYYSKNNCLIELERGILTRGCKNSVIPSDGSVTYIGDGAFSGCIGLKSITIPSGIEMGYGVFAYSDIESVIIPEGVTTIPDGTFNSCSELRSISLPKTLTCIEGYAFYGSGLYTISIPDGVTEIGESAFGDCRSLTGAEYDNAIYIGSEKNPYMALLKGKSYDITSCVINEKTKFILEYAFWPFGYITEIFIPESVTQIASSAFLSCTSLEKIEVAKGNSVYHSEGNCIIETQKKKIILGCKNSVIPSDGSVTSIGTSAFEDNDRFTSIIIPDGVTTIGHMSFSGCSSLKRVVLPKSLVSVDYHAFANCSWLNEVFYKGNASDWNNIYIDDGYNGNDCLKNATRYYYSEKEPIKAGNYWHYDVNGEIEIW